MEKIDKAIEVLTAFKEGKTIEYRETAYHGYTFKWSKWEGIPTEVFNDNYEYRIAKEPAYRPYANAEEFLKASKEHGPYIITQTYIKEGVIGETYCNIPNEVSNIGIKFNFDHLLFYWNRLLYDKELGLRTFVWQDGTPCGILEQ